MKALLAICMIVAAPFVWADEARVPNLSEVTAVKGEVLEVKSVESYTYLRLNTPNGEYWAAVTKAPIKKGAAVTIENVMVMKDFESKSLKKTFPTILFGTLVNPAVKSATGAQSMGTQPTFAKMTVNGDIRVPKANGSNALTVAEIVTRSAELKDQTVLVRGKVVKYNPEIMGKNWVHLRDGTGSTVDNSNDILVTTTNEAKLGEIVTAKGIVRTDQDFGSGYSYKVLIEDATLQ
ncbi:MAG: nucleotide-binding protein [Sideroxydans sp.]